MITVSRFYIKGIEKTVDFTIQDGVTFLEGDNGIGKTLFLDHLANLRKSRTGVLTGNESVVYMRQTFDFSFRLKVSQYIRFITSLDRKQVTDFKLFLEVYDIDLDLEKIMNRKIGMLSGGERRFLYLLTILCIEKDWYLLDEPLANVDRKTRRQMMDVIQKKREEGKNFVITSHIDLDLDNIHTINFSQLTEAEPPYLTEAAE